MKTNLLLIAVVISVLVSCSKPQKTIKFVIYYQYILFLPYNLRELKKNFKHFKKNRTVL